jgi:hypothetical protein
MKRTHISAAIAAGFALAAGQAGAQALTKAQFVAVPVANTLFISGATAPQQTLIDKIEKNICSNTFTKLRSTNEVSARYQAWGCTNAGAQIAVYYTTLGSSWGVQPVLNGTGKDTPRINPNAATCGDYGAGANVTTCTVNGIMASIPDVGVSDIAPSAFVGPNVPTTAVLAREFPELTVNGLGLNPTTTYSPVFTAIATQFVSGGVVDRVQGVVFGIAVNNPLTTLLQTKQGLPLINGVRDNRAPSLNKNVVSSILDRTLPGANEIDAALGINTAVLAGTRYVVCQRVPTSGTQAWANVYWLRNTPPAAANLTTAQIPATGTDWAGRPVAYVSNTTGGDVRSCLNKATQAGIPAIGIISAENSNNAGAGTNTWSFAKLDGIPMETQTLNTQASNLTNAKSGTYDNVGEVVLNRRGALTGVKNTVYSSLLTGLRGQDVCSVSGGAIATGALQIAGVPSATTACRTVWTRAALPFGIGKRLP